MSTKTDFDGITSSLDGHEVYTHEYIDALRKADEKLPNPHIVIPQRGGQELFLSTNADIVIYGGKRGGGKSWSLLADALYDCRNRHFNGIIFRNEINDLELLEKNSYQLYDEFGIYNCSKNDMTWNFKNGGFTKFSYYAGSFKDFVTRFQGHEYAYIGIDEITQMEYEKFKYILTCNRNSHFIPNRIFGTCNPDPDSWVAKFIDGRWIGEDGFPIPENNGKIMYCFMGGDDAKDVSSITWGETREEVYLQKKDLIDKLYQPYKNLNISTSPQDMFVKSVTFIEGKLEENLQLLRSDRNYVANLAQQTTEQVERDLRGNWKFKTLGNDLINYAQMEAFFANSYQFGDKIHRASCDVAFDGGDNLVLWHHIGNHIQDIFVCSANSKSAMTMVKAKLEEWGVLEENFVYDLSGIGQSFKGFFPHALPFNNREAVDDKFKGLFDNIKSQCVYMFYHALNDGEISINPELLSRRFSGKGYKNLQLRDILMNERKAIKKDINRTDYGFCVIRKPDMKKAVGHSPDFIESLVMKFRFNLKYKHKHISGLGWL
jgi:hypothetical protein